MSEILTVDEITSALLKNDEMPPDEDYSHYEYGEHVASAVSEERAVEIVETCLQELPASLAASFLDGFLTIQNSEKVKETMLGVVTTCKEVTSAANIVELLHGVLSVPADQLFESVRTALADSDSAKTQDRAAYAIQWIARRSTDKELRCTQLNDLLAGKELTDYSRECLEESLSALEKSV